MAAGQAVDGIVGELVQRHPRFPRATVERLVIRTFRTYHEARIQVFVPLLVRREVLHQLRYVEQIDPTATGMLVG